MASLKDELLAVLACPKCKADLTLADDEKGLICEDCKLVYPVRDGVPVMLLEEATPLHAKSKEPSLRSGSVSEAGLVTFLIVEGKNKGEKLEIERGSCRALGRSLDDIERTKIFSVDSSVSLDEASKKVVMQFVARQFNKGGLSNRMSAPGGDEISGFVRGADFPIRDLSVSRLHAMIFHDDSGTIGILDLVSKNGTYVNGAEVESKLLKKGDLISIGGIKLRFE
jgi:hypothetical protein